MGTVLSAAVMNRMGHTTRFSGLSAHFPSVENTAVLCVCDKCFMLGKEA